MSSSVRLVPKFSVSELDAERYGEVRELHEQMGALYPFPNLRDELFPIKSAVTDKRDEIACAGAIRIVGEAYLWVDKSRNLRDKLNSIGILEREMSGEARRQGFDQIAAWIPPQVPKGFYRLLREIGWQPSPWPTWIKNL